MADTPIQRHGSIIERMRDMGDGTKAAVVAAVDSPMTKKFEYNASGNPIYLGEARPGTAVSDAGWRLQRFLYDANGNVTDIQWADVVSGVPSATEVWNDRTSGSIVWS